jgi:cytoskeletal protein CcmA (bactofilin family)
LRADLGPAFISGFLADAPHAVQAQATAMSWPKPTILPEGWRLSGEIEVAGELHIGGRLDGTVLQKTNDAVVKVEQSGRVIGGIVAQTIEIHGQFEGHLDASGGSVAIEQTARLNGKVSYATIRMNGGEHKIELVHVATPSAATED